MALLYLSSNRVTVALTIMYFPLVIPAPDKLNVDSVDTTSATVSWSQSDGIKETKNHYQISYPCPGTEPLDNITTTFSTSITLSDLEPASEYCMTVWTVLENGERSQPLSTTFSTSKEEQ
jgi:hypothetical protein